MVSAWVRMYCKVDGKEGVEKQRKSLEKSIINNLATLSANLCLDEFRPQEGLEEEKSPQKRDGGRVLSAIQIFELFTVFQ